MNNRFENIAAKPQAANEVTITKQNWQDSVIAQAWQPEANSIQNPNVAAAKLAEMTNTAREAAIGTRIISLGFTDEGINAKNEVEKALVKVQDKWNSLEKAEFAKKFTEKQGILKADVINNKIEISYK